MHNHLRLVADLLEPWIRIKNQNFRDCEGIQCDMVKYFAKSLNFSFEIINENQGPGYQLENGTWTGVCARFAKEVRHPVNKLENCFNNLHLGSGYDILSIRYNY